MSNITRIEQAAEHELRVLKVADLATLIATDAFEGSEPDEIEEFIDEDYAKAHASVKEIVRAIDGLETFEMGEALHDGGFHGLLMRVGTPCRKYFAADMCSYSWSRYYTGWEYGATYEDAWAQAMDWAKGRQAADLDKFLKAQTAKFSRRQLQLLQMIEVGKSNRDIAEQLQISENTVKVHMWRLFKRLGVGSRTMALAAWKAAQPDELAVRRAQHAVMLAALIVARDFIRTDRNAFADAATPPDGCLMDLSDLVELADFDAALLQINAAIEKAGAA